MNIKQSLYSTVFKVTTLIQSDQIYLGAILPYDALKIGGDMLVVEACKSKKLIFTVTAGRTGTTYLTKLLQGVQGVTSLHEPAPDFVKVMRLSQTHPNTAMNFLCAIKLPHILQCQTPVYAETSHLFCKGFLEPMINLGLRPHLIFLRRSPQDVARSFFERGSIPTRTTRGIKYLLDPRDPNVMPTPNWELFDDYQMCFWYALEIERRQQFYRQMAQDIGLTIFDVTAKELNQWEVFAQMLTCFDLPITEGLKQHHGEVSSVLHNLNNNKVDEIWGVRELEEKVFSEISPFHPTLRICINKRYGGNS